jgi:hypothetical protein
MLPRNVIALLLVVLLAPCSTAATAQRYRVGKDSVVIPPPTGFVTVASHSVELPEKIRATFPSELSVIDVYATQAELDTLGSPPSLDRFFSVSVARGYEHFRATPRQFAELLPLFDESLGKAPDATDPIYRRESWARFYATGARLLPAYEEPAERYCANAFALIGAIPLQFMSCTLDRGAQDREWLRDAMNAWVETAHRLNLSPATPKGATTSPSAKP